FSKRATSPSCTVCSNPEGPTCFGHSTRPQVGSRYRPWPSKTSSAKASALIARRPVAVGSRALIGIGSSERIKARRKTRAKVLHATPRGELSLAHASRFFGGRAGKERCRAARSSIGNRRKCSLVLSCEEE